MLKDWLAFFTISFFTQIAFGENVNDLIDNHDIFIGDNRTQIVGQKNAVYPPESQKLGGKDEIIVSKAAYVKGGDHSSDIYDTYRLEISRGGNREINQINEARVKDYGVFQDSGVTANHFVQNKLISQTNCDADTREKKASLGMTQSGNSVCLTLNNEFCAEAQKQMDFLKLPSSLYGVSGIKVDDKKIDECMEVLNRVHKTWESLAKFATENSTYKSEASLQEKALQPFVDRSVKGLNPIVKNSAWFTEWNTSSTDKTSKDNFDKVSHGWRGLYELQKLHRNCQKLTPFFGKVVSPAESDPGNQKPKISK